MFCFCKTGVWCVLISVSKSPWHIFTACHSRGHPLSSVILVWFLVSHYLIVKYVQHLSRRYQIHEICQSLSSHEFVPRSHQRRNCRRKRIEALWPETLHLECERTTHVRFVFELVLRVRIYTKWYKKQKPCLIASQVLEHLQAKYPEKMNENHKSWNWMQGHRHTGCLLKMNLCFKSK